MQIVRERARNRARTSGLRLDFIVTLLDVKSLLNASSLESLLVVEGRASPPGWILRLRSGQARETPPPSTLFCLLLIHEVAAAVLLPAAFVRLRAERLFLAVADGFDAIAGYSSLHERILHRIGALGAQGQ